MLCNSGICVVSVVYLVVFFFKQKTAYEMRISDWSSDVCSSDLQRDRAEIGIERDIGPRVGSGGGRRIGRCGCGLGGEGEEREKHREHGQGITQRRRRWRPLSLYSTFRLTIRRESRILNLMVEHDSLDRKSVV